MTVFRVFGCAALLGFVPGCVASVLIDPNDGSATDGGSSTTDAGTARDAGTSPDAGSTDAGGTADAGPRPDAGGGMDAGPADAGSGTLVAVVVGYGGRRVTSTDGLTWDHFQQINPNGADDTDLLRGVGFGAGTFVAVGNRTFTSPDGIVWTERSPTSNFLSTAVYLNGAFVAAGGNGYRVRSLDLGVTWQDPTGYQAIHYRDLVAGNGVVVAVGHTYGGAAVEGVIAVTADGKTWNEVMHGGGGFNRVAFGNGVFVAAGESGHLASSTDGTNWTNNTVTGKEVAFVNSEFLLSSGTSVLRSTDGIGWSASTANRMVNAWFNSRYLMFGWPATIEVSTNLTQWSQVYSPMGSGFTRLAEGRVVR
jgi:hypothetical protein